MSDLISQVCQQQAGRTSWASMRAGAAVIALVLILVAGTERSPAAETELMPSYRALKGGTRFRVEASWNLYHDYAAAEELLRELATAHPEFAQLSSLGKTYGGREMWLLSVTDSAAGPAEAKPAFWIDGGIHANEIQAVEVPLYTAWYLLEMRPHNAFIAQLLREKAFYILPMMSPDSRDAHFYEPNTTHSPRTGQRPIDDDLDGLFDEDGYEDLDQDGSITRMIKRDPNGEWKKSTQSPFLLERVKPDEKGEYVVIGTEGLDNDGDGKLNEDGDGRYDPNRDWAWDWQPAYIQRGAYRYPFSIGENRLVADFIMAHPNIAGAQSYHNFGGMILRGPGRPSDKFLPADVAVYDKLAARGQEVLPKYRYFPVGEGLYTVYGGEIDWLHQMRGVFTFTNELFTPFNYFRHDPGEAALRSDENELQKFNEFLLFDGGYAAWTAYEHPEFGTVEIGGEPLKTWVRQPPSFLLEEECHRNMAFTLYHAEQTPQVGLENLEIKPLGNAQFLVTVAVTNDRLTPTHSQVDQQKKLTAPDVVLLQGAQVVPQFAMIADEPLFRSFTSQADRPERVLLDNVPGQGRRMVRWYVTGSGPARVTVQSVKGGTAVLDLELPVKSE